MKPAFIGIDHRNIQIYDDIGLDVFNIGQEAKVPLRTLPRAGESAEYFERLCREAQSQGYEYEVIPPERFAQNQEVYERINKEWIKNSNYIQRNFIPGKYEERYMKEMNFGVLKKDGVICAFSVIAASKSGYEASSGVVRHLGCYYEIGRASCRERV